MKIRTDFITNSSSSSFVLEVTIKMQDGFYYEFTDYSDEDEGKEFFVSASPRQLASVNSVEELIKMLKNKVLPGGGKTNTFIRQISAIPSMSKIRSITIRGDEENYLDYKRTYHYDRLTGEYKCVIEGFEFEKDGGSGGDLRFSDEGLAKEVDNFTELYATPEEEISCPRYLTSALSSRLYGEGMVEKLVIPDSVKVIGENSFVGDAKKGLFQQVKEIVLPSGIKEIGWQCFRNLPKLEKITIKESSKYEIVGDAIIEKGTQTLIAYFGREIGEYVIPKGVKYIADKAFWGACFERVVLPDEMIVIGNSAFEKCEKLKAITLTDKIQRVESRAFGSCVELAKVVIPKAVTYIDKSAFAHCKAVVMHVYEGSFAHKYAQTQNKPFEFIAGQKSSSDFLTGKSVVLTGFSEKAKAELNSFIQENGGVIKSSVSSKTDIVIWDTKYIGETSKLRTARELLDGGKPITILSDVEFHDVLAGRITLSAPVVVQSSNQDVTDGHLIITGVEKIPAKAYKDRLDIISVEIMGDVKEIGGGAFDGCKSLQNLILHEGIETIGDSAFYRCEKIENLEIPSTVKTIGSRGFAACKRIKNLILNDGLQSIEWAGFKGCIALERVVLPDSVKSLGGYIGQGVFENCKNLKQLELSASLSDPSSYLVSGCSKLEKLIIKSSLSACSYILGCGEYSQLCIEFLKMSLSDFINIRISGSFVGKQEGAKKVKFTDYEFDSDVDVLYIPGVMKNIPNDFFKCTGNREIRIDEGVASIGSFAFTGISNTETIYWPKSLNSISGYAFGWAEKIKDIYYAGTKADWSKINIDYGYSTDPWDKYFPTYTVHCSDGDIVVKK